jgi:sirohydrochlorin ferrochelatase
MAKPVAKRTRRGRGESAGTVPLFVEVAPEVKALVDRLALESGEAKWAVVEKVFNRLAAEMDGDALPAWWPSPRANQEELPLSKTA